MVYDKNNLFECDSLKFSATAIALTAVTPQTPLSLVQSTTLLYTSQIVVSWVSPLDNGGSALSGYTLEILDVLATTTNTVQLPTAATSYTFTGLTPGK